MSDPDYDTEARRIARITIARECAALEAGVTSGGMSARELEAHKDALVPAINMLIRLTSCAGY